MITLTELEQQSGKRVFCLDASASKSSSCLLRTWYTVIEGYRSAINSNDIEYGSAFHLFIKEMKRSGGNYSVAIPAAQQHFRNAKMTIKPTKKHLTVEHLAATCMQYWEAVGSKDTSHTLINLNSECSECHGVGSLKKGTGIKCATEAEEVWDEVCARCNGTGKYHEPMVELKFSLPYYEDDKFIVLLCGTIDDIAKVSGGCYLIRDYKTTSVWNKDDYLSGYELDCQLKFYKFILGLYATKYPNSKLSEIVKGEVRCQIRGIFLSAKDVTFQDSQVFAYSEADMLEFKNQLDDLMRRLLKHLEYMQMPTREGAFNGACKTPYGNCNYFNACAASTELARSFVLKNNFTQRKYDPLSF